MLSSGGFRALLSSDVRAARETSDILAAIDAECCCIAVSSCRRQTRAGSAMPRKQRLPAARGSFPAERMFTNLLGEICAQEAIDEPEELLHLLLVGRRQLRELLVCILLLLLIIKQEKAARGLPGE